MAHEASHVLLHKGLYPSHTGQRIALRPRAGRPRSGRRTSTYQCLERNLRPGSGDWREVQANKGMAALLMPKASFLSMPFRAESPFELEPDEFA